jgi:hypothetical protein
VSAKIADRSTAIDAHCANAFVSAFRIIPRNLAAMADCGTLWSKP